MSVSVPPGKQTFLDPDDGKLLSLGTVTHYVPSTTTFKNTWADEAQTQVNQNPITLDASASCSIWGNGLYRQIVRDQFGNLIWDRVTGFVGTEGDPTSFFNSVADGRAAFVASGTRAIYLAGYYAAGDGGAALYRYAASEPPHGGKFQSSDGAWWELAELSPTARMFGAKGDGSTDDTSAMQTAAAFVNLKLLTLYIQSGSYRVNDTINIRTSMIGESFLTTEIRALTAAAFADGRPIISLGWNTATNPSPCYGLLVQGFKIRGAGVRAATRSANPAALQFNGVGILEMEQAHGIMKRDMLIEFCLRGIDHGNNYGHSYAENVTCSNNWYGVYVSRNTGDYSYFNCTLTGNMFSSIGCNGVDGGFLSPGGVGGMGLFRVHLGFGPYGVYQEDGNGTTGLIGLTFIDARFEAIGNRAIRGGRTGPTPSGTVKNNSGWEFTTPAHTWVNLADPPSVAAYVIQGDAAHPVQDYAVTLDLVQPSESSATLHFEGDAFKIGTSGYHTRINDLIAICKSSGGTEGFLCVTQGRERVVSSSLQIYTPQPIGIPAATLNVGTSAVLATFDIPNTSDGTVWAEFEVVLSIDNASGVVRTIYFTGTTTSNATPQVTGPRYVLPVGPSTIFAKQRIALGTRVAGINQVLVHVVDTVALNMNISPGGLNSVAYLSVGQSTAIY